MCMWCVGGLAVCLRIEIFFSNFFGQTELVVNREVTLQKLLILLQNGDLLKSYV